MALHSLLEVALHFESFRNVDLFHQGLYHLKTKLYRETGNERLAAIPYGYSACPESGQPKSKSSRTDHHNLIPAHILEEQHTFSTRSYLIRYCEEEVELNDIGQFRFELSAEQMQDDTPLTLEVDLMFADLTHHGGADRFGDNPDVDSTEFKSVSTQTFRIHGADQGLHEYCPIVFDEYHFCVANLCIHSTLLDIRFRLQPNLPISSRPALKELKNPMDEVALMVQKPVVPPTQNAALSLTECMFGTSRGAGREQLLLATEAFYQTNFKILAKSYAGLVAWFHIIDNKCLTKDLREALGDSATSPEDQLTGCGLLLLPPNGSLQHWLNGNGATAGGHGGSFKSYLTSQLSLHADEKDFARHVALDMNVASCQILGLWHKVINAMLYSYREVTSLLRTTWEQRMSGQWKDFITKVRVQDNIIAPDDDYDEIEPVNRHLDILAKVQKQNGGRPVLVESMSLAAELQPMLFEQRHTSKNNNGDSKGFSGVIYDSLPPSAPKTYRGVHLFVLVHGFQGNAFDMRLFKNNLALVYPDAIFMVSSSNEDNTDGDLNEMGIRLAQEVVNFVTDWCPDSSLGRLSFVGYSIGGVIIRAALPLLHDYHSKFYTFLTLSTAHFGFMDQQSPLFNSTVYLLTKWRKCTLLEQLALRDAPDLKDTYLAKLCKTRGLEHFQWIVLLSSKQDNYSPSKSSRMEMDPSWEKSPSKEVYVGMLRSVWENVIPERVLRLRAHFNIPEKNVDAMIGRVAHIRFIECQPIMRLLIHSYGYLFG